MSETGQVADATPDEGQVAETAPEVEAPVVVDPEMDKLTKSNLEAQRKITQLGQENAALKKSQNRTPIQEQASDDDYFENPTQTVKRVSQGEARSELNRFKWELAINAEKGKDAKGFNRLQPFLTKVAEANPHLDADPSNLPLMVEMAKEARMNELKDTVEQLHEAGLIGDKTEIVNDRAKVQNMPINSATVQSPKKQPDVDPSDVDAVTAGIFAGISEG